MSVRELNQRTSAVLKDVAAGGAVTITSDGRPIARLVPIGRADPELLDRLVATGRALAATITGRIPVPPAYGDEGNDVAAALAIDRDLERW
ncbi:MAG TPA: type II toxin-antitoxin system prevent-host-death family antitoxin [Actinomycetota bacterium]